MTVIFAAWLIVAGMAMPIPFASMEDCELAKKDIQSNGYWSPAATCIHGERPTKQPGDQ